MSVSFSRTSNSSRIRVSTGSGRRRVTTTFGRARLMRVILSRAAGP